MKILLLGLLAVAMILASGYLHDARLKMKYEIEQMKQREGEP